MLCGPGGGISTGREQTRVPTLKARVVCGPWSTTSALNSWPMMTSRLRSMTRGLPARFAVATNWSANLSACRSEPQMPQASVRTSTSPGPGCGIGTSATTSLRSRITAARMVSITSSPRRRARAAMERRPAGLAGQERHGLLEELAEGRLRLQEQVVASGQGHEARARNARRHPPPSLERHASIVAGVQYERRYAHPRQERAHIDLVGGRRDSRGHLRRDRDPLELVEPVGLLLGPAGHEL